MKKNMMKDKCIRMGALVLSFAVCAVPAASGITLMYAVPVMAGEALGTFDSDDENTAGSMEDVLVGIGAGQEKTAGSTGQAASDSGQDSGQDYGQSYSQGAVQPYSQGAVQSSGGSSSGAVTGDTAKEDDSDGSWKLMLVNAHHPIPEGYEVPELTQLQNGNSVDSRIYPALQKMFDDARAQGIYPYVTSSYRTMEKQQQLMDDKISEYVAAGYSQEEAKKLAEEWVAIPGTSEHQLGLSVDISSDPASGQDPGSVWYWLKIYCWDYGFIIRYPEDKTDITGIINEPWHFRYVGEKAAQEIKESGQSLEEYLGIVD